MRLKLKGAHRDMNGNLCAEEVQTFSGRTVARAGQCQWEGLIIIEKDMEHLFDVPKGRKAKR